MVLDHHRQHLALLGEFCANELYGLGDDCAYLSFIEELYWYSNCAGHFVVKSRLVREAL